jgi:very-short-patch-repair endonuclease
LSRLVRPLRKKLTDAERWLWNQLRNRNFAGWKFRRQHPIGPFIVDFGCLEKKLIIEVDGGQHARKAEADANRTAFLEGKGFKIVRFWNHQVLREGTAVTEAILSHLDNVPTPEPVRRQENPGGKSLKPSPPFSGEREG